MWGFFVLVASTAKVGDKWRGIRVCISGMVPARKQKKVVLGVQGWRGVPASSRETV